MLKIKSFGIVGQMYDWIEDWIKDRQQRAVILGKNSNWIKVKSGIPKGSVLGPLLFLIYRNDIDDSVGTNILKFADDTKIYSVVANQDDVARLQDDLKNLCYWSREWLMLFYIAKCKVMHLGRNNVKVY